MIIIVRQCLNVNMIPDSYYRAQVSVSTMRVTSLHLDIISARRTS